MTTQEAIDILNRTRHLGALDWRWHMGAVWSYRVCVLMDRQKAIHLAKKIAPNTEAATR